MWYNEGMDIEKRIERRIILRKIAYWYLFALLILSIPRFFNPEGLFDTVYTFAQIALAVGVFVFLAIYLSDIESDRLTQHGDLLSKLNMPALILVMLIGIGLAVSFMVFSNIGISGLFWTSYAPAAILLSSICIAQMITLKKQKLGNVAYLNQNLGARIFGVLSVVAGAFAVFCVVPGVIQSILDPGNGSASGDMAAFLGTPAIILCIAFSIAGRKANKKKTDKVARGLNNIGMGSIVLIIVSLAALMLASIIRDIL